MSRAIPGLRSSASAVAGLKTQVRELHRSNVEVANVAWIAVAAAMILSIVGVTAIATTQPGYATRQIAILGVAVIAGAAAAIPHYRLLQRFSTLFLLVVIALLVFVLMPWVPESIVAPRNGARRWINLGVTDLQPSELAKVAYVAALASYLRYRENYRRFLGLLVPFVLTFVPMGLVLVEPDLGTALLFLPTLFAMLIAAGAKLRHLVLIALLGLAVAPISYPFLQPHQKDRIDALYYQIMDDPRYAQDIGFQGAKATMLVGSGGLTGVGREKAADLVNYNHLPEEHNDMVFAVICCRWGTLGGVAVWGLFALLCGAGLTAAAMSRDPFGRLVAVGLVALLFTQMVINTGMTIGILPITGMTLPFVSYGGSSLVVAWIMVGLLLNVGLRRPQYLARESFEFDGDDDR